MNKITLMLGMLAVTWMTAQADPQPAPAYANVAYGPHPHEIMDIYTPQGPGPFPVVLWYGGIWKSDKGAPDLNNFFPFGVALIAVETRGMEDSMGATPRPNPPISWTMLDARRALQFVRLHAADYHLNPDKIATAGGSQGTLPALYAACEGEKKDDTSTDELDRTSTLVICCGAWRSQCTLDPKLMQEWVPGVIYGEPAWGCSFAESLQRHDELMPLIRQWSPDQLVSGDTPPIYFEYDWGMTKPADVTDVEYKVHSPLWGTNFQKLMQSKGATCYLRYPGKESEKYKNIWDFLVQTLTAK